MSPHKFHLPLRIGLIGVGKIARDQHVSALLEGGRFALVATADPHGRIGGVDEYDDAAAMIAGVSLQAVSICTPPAGRSDLARLAIAAGLHVMLEKPPAASLIDLAAITQAAHAAEVSLFASWHAREAPGVAVARDWLAGRSIEAIRVRWLEDIRIWHPGQEWILTSVGLGVFDPGINAFSILTALLRPRIEVVHAELVRPAGHDAALSARIGAISGGTVIDIELDFLHDGPPCWDIDIVSNGAVLRLTDGGHHISIDGVAQPLAATHEYAMLYRRFAHLIEQGVSDVDAAPLRLVEDIMAVAQWRDGGAFAWDAGAARASAAIAGRAPA